MTWIRCPSPAMGGATSTHTQPRHSCSGCRVARQITMGKSTLFAQGPIMTRTQLVCQNSMCTSSPRLAPASPPSPPRRLSSTPPPTARFDAWPPLLKWRAGLPAMCTSCGKLLPSLCRWRADTGRGDADPPPLPAPASSPSTLRNARCALLLPRAHTGVGRNVRSTRHRAQHTVHVMPKPNVPNVVVAGESSHGGLTGSHSAV